jgi:hypothetical protein
MGHNTYFASKAHHHPFVGALSVAGVPLVSTWHDWKPNVDDEQATPDEWREHSERCLREAAEANICLLYYQSNERHFGSLLEAGSCIGAGGWCYLVTDGVPPPFLASHPRCRVFSKLSDAVASICAQRNAARRAA